MEYFSSLIIFHGFKKADLMHSIPVREPSVNQKIKSSDTNFCTLLKFLEFASLSHLFINTFKEFEVTFFLKSGVKLSSNKFTLSMKY